MFGRRRKPARLIDYYRFTPADDITAAEIAFIMANFLPIQDFGFTFIKVRHEYVLPDNVKRHYTFDSTGEL